ncbi:MAG: HIT family protein [Candidatus Aenigmatarchaeota archaeon]
MDDCLFCDIVKGNTPAWKIYEDDHFLAFLDVYPASKGHALVIPKEHHPELLDLPDYELKHALEVVQKVADAVCEAVDADGFNILQSNNPVAGQEVFHIHFHIIPRFQGDDVTIDWEGEELDDGNAQDLLKKIKDCM